MKEKINPENLFIIKIYTFKYCVKFSFWVSVLLMTNTSCFCIGEHYLPVQFTYTLAHL